jgi:hypothetical protein
MAGLLVPLNASDCSQVCSRELGAAQLTLTPYCVADGGDTSDYVIKCSDQRDALNLMMGLTYIDVRDQCSVRPRKIESSKKMELDVSVGCLATDPRTWGIIFGSAPEKDPNDDNCSIINIRDNVGRTPQYWQVHIQPIENGSVSNTWEIYILYAYVISDQAQLSFSADQPKNLKFKLEGFPHPTTGDIGFSRWCNA